MKSRHLFLGLLLWLIPLILSGQRTISGRITDAEDGEPVPSVSVFISNTTAGTFTDLEGNYRLEIPGRGSYRLAISHAGYQTVFEDIEPGSASITFDVALDMFVLDEVTVSLKVKFRQKDINLFWNTLLGKKPSKKTIYPTNPETVYYYYNEETKILKVTCREPLEIINNETGYHIQLVVKQFTHDYNTDITLWSMENIFTELDAKDDKQKKGWEKNRKRIYQSSLLNFIRALYNNTLMEEGYLLVHPGKKDAPTPNNDDGNGYEIYQSGSVIMFDPVKEDIQLRLSSGVYQNPETFLSSTVSSDGSKALYIPSVLDTLILVCYGRQITQDDLIDVDLAQKGKFNWSKIGSIRNIIQTANDPVHIFPDGTYKNRLIFSSLNNSYSLAGLNLTLPNEYTPDALLETLPLIAETDILLEDELAFRFEQQLNLFPQEKIYVHTDKPYYISGERIWFRAYLVDAVSHVPLPLSRYVYVELINPSDSIVTRVKIRQEEEAYHGHLLIPDDVPEGAYTLRAYTTFMRSLDENYFWSKTVYIGDPQSQAGQAQIPASDDDFDVGFYPEGGSLMLGAFCKIAFKAVKSNGQASHISGVVYDRDGTEIREFQSDHLGMGGFLHLAEKGKSYYVVCQNDKGQTKRFDLPVALERGYALSVNQLMDNVHISVVKPEGFSPNNNLYLLAHVRGAVYFSEPWNHEEKIVVIQKELLPSGVLHFILFDTGYHPVSERLVFINNQNQPEVNYQPDKERYAARSLVNNRITVTDSDGMPVVGSFSVSVTSDGEVTPDSTSNILSYLLLTSDLHGNIENPAYYFQNTATSSWALDLLMCTQGWRRYDIAELSQGRFSHLAMPVEMGMEISGTVKSVSRGRPVEDVEVMAFSSEGGYFNRTITDKDGRFYLTGGELPDGAQITVNAGSGNSRTGLELLVDKESFPKRTLSPIPPAEINRMLFAKYAGKAERHYLNEGGFREYLLPEVTISARRTPARQSAFYDIPSGSSITGEDIEKSGVTTNVYDLLRRISGVRISGGYGLPVNISIRSEVSFGGGGVGVLLQPLLLVDDVQMDIETLEIFDVHEIARIDVLKEPEAAIFGTRGGAGVIVVSTKRGEVKRSDILSIPPAPYFKIISPLAYQQPAEFYSPKYDTPEKQRIQIPDLRTTIHWQPVVQTDNLGVASFEFYTADEPASYTVTIEGLADDGSIIRLMEKIRIE